MLTLGAVARQTTPPEAPRDGRVDASSTKDSTIAKYCKSTADVLQTYCRHFPRGPWLRLRGKVASKPSGRRGSSGSPRPPVLKGGLDVGKVGERGTVSSR